MNNRPKPNEDEEDLLKLQQAFLSSSSAGQTSVTIKRPDKRRTDDKQTTPNRDVVAMEASTSVEPSVVPIKKSKFRTESGPDSSDQSRKPISHRDKEADGENIEELMDKKDRSLAAVLTTIIERDTRNEMYVAPVMSRQAFPSVRPMDSVSQQSKSQSTPPAGKTKRKSLFAQQVEAQGAKHFGVEPRVKPFGGVSEKPSDRNRQETESYTPTLPGPCVIDGGGLSVSNRQSESQKIHEENMEKLSAMSQEEIMEEQKKLLEMIDPKLVEFLRNKRKVKEKERETSGAAPSKQVSFSVHKEMKKKQMQSTTAEGDDEGPVKPSKDWLNMSTVERDKLEWMKDLPPPASVSSQTGRPARFDFKGHLMAVDADVPVNIGLHHHGEEPERAGYSLEELFQLARSSNIQQRSLALHTLARVICQAKSGYLSGKIETPIIPAILAGGVVMLLRWALDDSVEAVVFAAVDALHALLCSSLDEKSVDTAWVWYLGHIMPALTPTATLEKEAQPAEDVDFENQEEETDADVVKRDVIQALVTRMELLIRFRYIFNFMKPQAVTVVQILDVLSRISQHSSGMAYEVMKCPGLMEKIVKEYLPTAWAPQDHDKPVSDVSGLPVPAAMRLLRSLCQAGRNIASVLVSKFQLNMILLHYLAVQSSDLQLHQREATNLQAETLAVWRVCATYGLLSQTYFDMYSNILPFVGKLADRWMSALGKGEGDHKPTETSHNSFEEHLLCVIEKILCVAASSRKQPGFTGSNPGSKETSSPPINWSHVTALVQPIRTCVAQMLSEIGAHYPVKKHNLTLPTACLNFLATFCELEGKQKGIDEVSSLEALENLCSSCLGPLLTSFGLSVIIENLCQYSNILASSAFLPVETSPSLPTLCVCQVTDNEEMPADPDTSPEEWKINMPLLRHHSPFGFLTALMRMMLVTCRRHKSMIPKLLDAAVNNKDILMYMKKVCSVSKSPFSTVHFTTAENLFQYYWLKCCTLMPCKDMSLAHRVSLHLIARLQHGDEHLVHDLVSTVVFTASFISEGEETQLASQAMASMSLSETLHLKSASQEEINISKHQLLQDVYKSLAKIRGHFIMAFGGMEKAVQDSRNLFVGNCQEICSQLIKGGGESLMPRDWTYMPLIHVYNKATQTNSVSGVSMSPQAVSMVTSVLQWNYALEMWRPVEMDSVSVTLRLSRIMCAFIAGSDLFLEKPVNQYLAGLLRVLTSQKLLDKMDFEEKIPGILSFYDLYQEFLDHYEAVSFGDPVFGLYVLLPLQQKHSFMLRKAVWGERRKLLRTLRVPLNEMLIPIQNYLEPDETDTDLLQLYLSALVAKAVQPTWSPVMYLLAVHHVNRFLYLSVADDNVPVRSHMWRQVLANENQMSDVIYYKQADISLPRGLELYEQLPANRQNTLDKYKSVKKS